MPMSNPLMLVLVNPQPSREQEYADWYANQHLVDMVGVPSVLNGKLHTATDHRPSQWRHAAIYQLAGDPMAVLDEISEYGKAGKIAPSTASDSSSRLMAIATSIADRVGGAGSPENALFVVLTNPVDGQDDEYNRWYNDQHVDDVLAVPGFVGVQRFKLSVPSGAPAPDWKYLALYEIEKDRVSETFEGLSARAGTDRMQVSPALSRGDTGVGIYAPVAEKAKGAPAS